MWTIETGIDLVEKIPIHTVVNLDLHGKEIRRIGFFSNAEDAQTIMQILNKLNIHSAAAIANYIDIKEKLIEVAMKEDK